MTHDRLMNVPGRRGARGWALGTTLACMVALCVVLFAAVSAGISHMRLVSASSNSQHATNLAEAALAKAVVRLVESDYTFGKNGTDRLEISVSDLPGSSAVVTFDETESPDAHSTFNLEEDGQKIGARSHNVPGRSVHLVARGKVGSSESLMECVYHKPPFPDGLAASGPIEAKALYLAGVRRGQAYSGGDPEAIPPEDLMPANLFSNAAGPEAAKIGENCRIIGSAGAVGTVSVHPSSTIQGEVLPNSEPRAIPEIDIHDRIEALKSNAVDVPSSGGDVTLEPDWFGKATSGLTVGGNLKLNGSALLVTGDLRVAGAIEGTGVILVEGEVEIGDGRSNVTSSDQVAIACTKDFSLRATAPEGNYFQGLVYCEGNFEAKDITVVGATVVNGKNGAVGSAKLDNVRFVQSPGGVQLELSKVVAKGANANNWAWSFTLKPDPNGEQGDFLCDARAYQGDFEISGCDPDHVHTPANCPNVEKPLVWKNDVLSSGDNSDGFGSWSSVTGETHLVTNTGIDTVLPPPAPGTAYPNGIPVKMSQDGRLDLITGDQTTPLGTELFKFFTTLQERGDTPGDSHDGVREMLEDKVEATFQNASYQVTFNVNTLLGESIGSSRALVWKPFR